MQKSSREEARILGNNIYFTGKPCKNNHISYRYVQSGSCAECVNGHKFTSNKVALRDERMKKALEVAGAREEIKAALRQMPPLKVRCFVEDKDMLLTSAWSLALQRFPMLSIDDIDTLKPPTGIAAGTALYQFNCHVEDIEALRSVANQALARHSCQEQIERTRQAVIDRVKFQDTTPGELFT